MAFTQQTKQQVRFSNSPIKQKMKFGGTKVVSRALVKEGVTNLVPKVHVRAGDLVMLMSGSDKAGRGQTGKILNVFPKEGKVIVEGLNMITRATKARNPMGKSGHIKREGKIFACRVMLYCTSCKKPTRAGHKLLENGKKSRACKHCNEALDT
jgi:large subunit ribosomal protein L24